MWICILSKIVKTWTSLYVFLPFWQVKSVSPAHIFNAMLAKPLIFCCSNISGSRHMSSVHCIHQAECLVYWKKISLIVLALGWEIKWQWISDGKWEITLLTLPESLKPNLIMPVSHFKSSKSVLQMNMGIPNNSLFHC